MTFGIAVIFAFLVFSIIDVFYAAPEYGDYCSEVFDRPMKMGYDANCTDIQPDETCYLDRGTIRYEYGPDGCPIKADCDYCGRDYDDARKQYETNMFYIAAPIGLVSLILGMYLPLVIEAIASGFMFGGIAVLVVSTMRVFGSLSKVGRVLTLAFELVLIVWLGIKKVSDFERTKKRRK